MRQQAAPAPASRNNTHLLLALTIVIATALRLFRLGSQSFWIDEFFTLQNVAVGLDTVTATALTVNNAPPLYFFLVWPFRALLGEAEWVLRLPSAICGILSVPLLFQLTLKWSRCRRTALIAALLLALNPLHLWYSQEARNYTLILLLLLASCLMLERALATARWRDWIITALLGLAATATATQGIVVFALLGIRLLLAHADRDTWRKALPTLGSAALAALLLAAWVAAANSRPPPPRPFTGAELAYSFYCYNVGYSFGPSQYSLQTLPLKSALWQSPLQLTLGFLLVAATLASWRRHAWRNSLLPLAWLLAGLGFGIAIHLATPHSYHIRYTLPALIGWLMLTARATSHNSAAARRLLAAHLVLALWSCSQWFFVPQYGKDDTREAVVTLRSVVPEISRVWIAPSYMQMPVDWYGAGGGEAGLEVVKLESAAAFDPQPAQTALLLTRPQHIPFMRELRPLLEQACASGDWMSVTSRTYRIYYPLHGRP